MTKSPSGSQVPATSGVPPASPIICLLSSARNAGKHLRGWFEYHRSLGINRFYVIDHVPSEDDTSQIIAAQPDAVVLRRHGPFDESRWSADLCNTAIQDGAQAIFPNDTDEFLCSNGKGFRDQVTGILQDIEEQGITGLHYLSPGFNMFPSEDLGDQEDWRCHVLARPNPLFTGKSAIFLARHSGHVVTNGCQHRLRFRPPLPCLISPKTVPPNSLELPPKHFPFYYLHFPFHGPTAFLRRVHTFLQGTREKVWQMATRYGEGILDEEDRLSGNLTDVDLKDFVLKIRDISAPELYRRAVLDAGLPRATEVRLEVANFFGVAEATSVWTPEFLERSLRSFGGLDRAGAGPLTEAEFTLWPVGAVQLQLLDKQRRLALADQR